MLKRVKSFRGFTRYRVITLALFIVTRSNFRADEGQYEVYNDTSSQITTFVVTNGESENRVLIGGRAHFYLLSSLNRYVGWIKQMTGDLIGDPDFQAANLSSNNPNVAVNILGAGSLYFDFSGGNQKENLATTAVWDTNRDVWWVMARVLYNYSGTYKYRVLLLKVTPTGDVTEFEAGIGGGTDESGNYHGLLGGPKGVIFINGGGGSNDKILFTGYRGQMTSFTPAIENFHPYVAEVTNLDSISSPISGGDITITNIDNVDTGASNWRGIALVANPNGTPTNVQIVYTPITIDITDEIHLANYSLSSKTITSWNAVNLDGYDDLTPTSMVTDGTNLYISGAAVATANNPNNKKSAVVIAVTASTLYVDTDFNK